MNKRFNYFKKCDSKKLEEINDILTNILIENQIENNQDNNKNQNENHLFDDDNAEY